MTTQKHTFTVDLANQPPGFWVALIMKLLIGIGVFLYLATHSLNYFRNTFKAEQEIFSYLGLLTTSIGFIGWLTIFKWMAFTNFEKTIALFMTFVSLIGELYVAGYDIIYNTSATAPSVEEIRTMGWVVAGLASIHGLALLADFAGLDVMVLFSNMSRQRSRVQTETETAPEIRVFVNPNMKAASFSDKTNAFYCPPSLEAQAREFIANPNKWESVEAFLKHINGG